MVRQAHARDKAACIGGKPEANSKASAMICVEVKTGDRTVYDLQCARRLLRAQTVPRAELERQSGTNGATS